MRPPKAVLIGSRRPSLVVISWVVWSFGAHGVAFGLCSLATANGKAGRLSSAVLGLEAQSIEVEAATTAVPFGAGLEKATAMQERPPRGMSAQVPRPLTVAPNFHPSKRETAPPPASPPATPHDARTPTNTEAPKCSPSRDDAGAVSSGGSTAEPALGALATAAPTSNLGAPSAYSEGGASRSARADAGEVEKQRYFETIRALITARKRYPLFARRRRIEGTVVVRFTLGRDGKLLATSISQGSGSTALDEAAIEAIRSIGALPAAPASAAGTSFTFVVPIVFRLSASETDGL